MAQETNHAKHKKEVGKAEDSKQLTFDEPEEKVIDKELPVETTDQEVTEVSEPEADTKTQPEELVEVEDTPIESKTTDEAVTSVKAHTHARNKKAKKQKQPILPLKQKQWQKILALSAGGLALVALLVSGVASQYYKNKVMPSVIVAGINSSAKTESELTKLVETKRDSLAISFTSGEKKFQPKLSEIGLQVNTKKTVENALMAKRKDGVVSKVLFWKKVTVPVVITINDNLLNQYIEANLPELLKPPQDSQLQFDAKQVTFVATPQADGQAVDTILLKKQLSEVGNTMTSTTLKVAVAKRGPAITEAKIKPLLAPANKLVAYRVVLTGLGYSFQARPADIAAWLTPTPQKDGSLALIVDTAKVQSYVDSISKRISSAPVDRKVIKDQQTGAEVVIQEGRSGTELADKQTLASAITTALKSGQGTIQTMNITTANFQTVNMEAYEKWIEVDLSEQRTTAYERATPVKNFLIASGTKGHETVTGEFAIWHKNRKQTMQGGSRADGSYYSIPNVEWVSYFYKDYALHGAWWREKFGAPASHGCVNMTNADAKWVYEWAALGTKVIVHQ